MPSTTKLEEEEIVDAPGSDGNVSMLEQVKRPNPWRIIIIIIIIISSLTKHLQSLTLNVSAM
jgi:hypothetical protein